MANLYLEPHLHCNCNFGNLIKRWTLSRKKIVSDSLACAQEICTRELIYIISMTDKD